MENMHSTESHLRTILTHGEFYETACILMAQLSASDIGALFAALQVIPSCSIRRNFLHPLRDIDRTMRIFKPWMHERCQILIMGPDSRLLVQRIQDPDDYHGSGNRKTTQLVVFVLAIPPTFQAYAKEALVLHRISEDSRRPTQERGRAFTRYLDTVGQHIFKQHFHNFADLPLLQKEDKDTRDFTIHGDYVQVKVLDPLTSRIGGIEEFALGLDFEGLHFLLPWDMGGAKSGLSHWKATDGIPYIDAADPFHVKEGALDSSMRLNDDMRRAGGRKLVFYSDAPERTTDSTVFIPVNHTFPACM